MFIFYECLSLSLFNLLASFLETTSSIFVHVVVSVVVFNKNWVKRVRYVSACLDISNITKELGPKTIRMTKTEQI